MSKSGRQTGTETNDRLNVLPFQGRVIFEDFLETAPTLQIVQDDIQRDASAFDARRAAHDPGIDTDSGMVFQEFVIRSFHRDDSNKSDLKEQTPHERPASSSLTPRAGIPRAAVCQPSSDVVEIGRGSNQGEQTPFVLEGGIV